MPRPVLYVAITHHGFGHLTRTASVVAEIQQQLPDLLPILVTNAPRWLIEAYLPGDFIHRPRALDVGVIQTDSLSVDKATTLAKLRQLQAQAKSLIVAEVDFIQQNRVSLILADIPPLAAAIAQESGIPCWMTSNFGWDFIYRAWEGEFVEIADWIAERYRTCDCLFRLPFHEPMSAFPRVVDVGLTGGTPRYSTTELQAALNLRDQPEQTVLLTFGGLGLNQIPYRNLDHFPDWQFLTFDRQAPSLPNLRLLSHPYRPVDVMPLCRQVVSKPGYGTFAEACRTDTPIISITREDFAESALLLEGIRNYCDHQILSPEEFFGPTWQFLHQPLHPPAYSQPIDVGGNEAIADAVVDFFRKGG
ncbi:hypothetical protein AVDCRST_MAG81-3791 [uncultured Synechococcales cyanobacterium]|uniref:Glycosyl transferase n=1 Tax=uncultured Synechococcales cyanobacterium TaxID=1936017 RepID=A0A6J4VSP7_9CYAN|nr:hypothetical protein AVDCRST_MAG81-3791 [uncultured Synechococcales cyanobacterium]